MNIYQKSTLNSTGNHTAEQPLNKAETVYLEHRCHMTREEWLKKFAGTQLRVDGHDPLVSEEG